MRRFTTIALIGLAVAAAATDAVAQGRPGRVQRAGVADTARMRRADSIRVARGDTAIRRRAPDSLRQKRIDSLRAAGALDSNRLGRGARAGDVRGRGPGAGPMARGGGALMGIQLNDNEKAAIKAISEKYREEYRQLREANLGAARDRNMQLATQIRLVQEKEQAEIRAALTSEHQAQFDANLAKRKEMAAKAPTGRRPPRPPAR